MQDNLSFKTLENTSFELIMESFFKSFDNYFVQFPKDNQLFQQRFKAAKVDYTISVGVFDGDKLVAFILHAKKEVSQEGLKAFNIATGVIPTYRGCDLVGQMYNFIIPKLQLLNVKEVSLEVITENLAAINTYLKSNFKITKYYKCFSGPVTSSQDSSPAMKKINKDLFNWPQTKQEIFSWENQRDCILDSDYDYYVLQESDKLQAYLIINPYTGYIPQYDVTCSNDKLWNAIFNTIKRVTTQCKINNVDSRLATKIKKLKEAGLTNHLNQFEMILNI